jgi:ABC-type multidrug transport system ATPase subunit
MFAVETHNLHKSFDSVNALKNVSFAVSEGEIFGIIGADGAGKTTLLRILTTLITADTGSAAVLGKDINHEYAAIRKTVGYMPQRFSLYQDLSVRENIVFFADVFGIPKKDRAERMNRLLSFARLTEFQKRRAGNLSGGMKQKLALCCALIHTPSLLILDEPTTGVDPVSRQEFWEILFGLKQQGITIIVSTPYMDEATRCDTLLILHNGEIIRDGTPGDLIAGYPHALFSVTCTDGGLMVPGKAALPPGALLMYPSAGSLHIAAGKDAAPEDLLSHIKKSVPEAAAISRANPTIEDLLFYLLSQKRDAA